VGKRRAAAETRRDAEFATFVAGAGGRLLHSATLLTGDPADAERLLTTALARLHAGWLRLGGDDPYERARGELFLRYAYRTRWHHPHGGVLEGLTAQERLVVTMRYFEGIGEDQAAALLGLAPERVAAIAARGGATLRSRPLPLPPARPRRRRTWAVGP
jgi:DNA-directed RNA polymerase specialized sigma24 family protein